VRNEPGSQEAPKSHAPASASRLKAAVDYRSVASDLQLEANGDIQCVREQVAKLWWHAESAYRTPRGETPEASQRDMAQAACIIGITLNQLDDKLRLLYENFEAATKVGAR
jgi:hypothetical protein